MALSDEDRKARDRLRARAWYWANREKALEKNKGWYEANPGRARLLKREQGRRRQ